jgi:hypothetical protein
VKRKLVAVPILAIGVVVFWAMTRGARGPERVPEQEEARRVRIIAAPKLDVIPRAVGYGTVRPGRSWKAVPEVGGRIIEMNPQLREGIILKKDTILVRIDSGDYDLEVVQAESQILSIDAQTEQLDARSRTVSASLTIEEASLKLSKGERNRVKKLVEKGSLTQAQLDQEERQVLAQTARVQEIKNTLELIGPDRKVLQTKRALEVARLQMAERNVLRTVIRAPFACRVGPVHIEEDSVVQKGQEIFSADSIATSEVTGQFVTSRLSQVFAARDTPIDPSGDMAEVLKQLGLSAVVRLHSGKRQIEWKAEVTRVEGVDSQTRTTGIVVAVKGTYAMIRPGTRPPLVRGMYVEVFLSGPARPGLVIVPRSAIHSGHVYLVDSENRLERRAIKVEFVQSSFAAIASGLNGGEQVVLSDVYPAVAGMLLDPEIDEDSAALLAAEATDGSGTR